MPKTHVAVLTAAIAIGALTCGASPVRAQTTTVASAAVITTEDPAVTRRALEWLERAQNGDIDRAQLSSTINAKFTPEEIGALRSRLQPLGKPFGAAFGGAKEVSNTMVYRYVVAFRVGSIEEYISLDRAGKIAGLVFTK